MLLVRVAESLWACDLRRMARNGHDHSTGTPRARLSGTDAAILAAAVFGILTGLSLVRFEIAVVAGLAILGYVIVKLLTTKVE
jgi:hypothetical protein